MPARSLLLAAVTIAVAVAAGHAQEARPWLTGIVEVPAVLNRFTPDGHEIPAERPIELRARPALDSPVVATIREAIQLQVEEYGYEESGAVAYARRLEWTLVKTRGGIAGWLAPADAGRYHSLESLLEDHAELADLTDAWDGWIHPSAGSGARRPVPVDPGRNVIGFLEPTVEDASRLPIFERADRRSTVLDLAATGNPERALRTTGQVPYQIVVLDRRPGWFRVARAGQMPGEIDPAWLAESPVWRFHPANAAEGRELGRRAWGSDNPDVRVIGTRRIGDVLWVNIEVLDHSLCVGTTPIVRQRGWIPAHAPSGEPNIWYPSRGC